MDTVPASTSSFGKSIFSSLTQVKDDLVRDAKKKVDILREEPTGAELPPPPPTTETDWVYSALYLLGLFLLGLLVLFILGFFVKILWNFVMPALFGIERVKHISWLPAVSLVVLIRLLFL